MQQSKAIQKLIHRDSWRTRNLLLFGAIIFPLWGHLLKIQYPNAFDPLWIRYLISATFLLTFWGTYKIEYLKKSANQIIEFVGWIVTLHSFVLCFYNAWTFNNLMGLTILGSAMYSVMRFKKTALLYSIVYLSLASLSISHPHPESDPMFVMICAICVVTIGALSFRARVDIFEVLMHEERRNSVFLSSMREGALMHRPNGAVIWHNDAVLTLTGLSTEQLHGKAPLPEHYGYLSEDGSKIQLEQTSVGKCWQTAQPQTDEILGVKLADSKVRWVRLSVQPFQAPGEEQIGSLSIFIDVTEEKLQKDQLVEQQGKLVASAKLTALGEMAAGIAHEINNPLTIIAGKAVVASRLLKADVIDKEKMNDHLNKIGLTVTRITKIVQGIKNFARDSSHDSFTRTNLGELIEDTFNLYYEKFSKAECEIFKDVQEGLFFDGRGSEVQQVFLNLLQNALDATENRPEKWIKVRAYKSGSNIVMEVSDSGEGISPEIRNKIMQPFFTTKPVGKGTGLGLSISMNIIKSHHGVFELLDTQKTTFRITLPKAEAQGVKQAA